MGKIIAIANQKGGVGKTTTTVNLAASLGVLEKSVLVIDADPQANATSGLGVEVDEIEIGTYQMLEHTADARETIIKTSSPNVDLIPSHIDLVAIEIELVDKNQREYMMKQAIADLREQYDYILIDCAPSLGLLTLNALTSADSVIIPIQCEYFALEGLGKLLNTIKSVQRIHNPDLDIEGMLLTMYDSRLRLSN
ncbi:MAG: AAA family ATPase, partial [Eudoraea sp.]|nr:AAA family ATPase [Eudoraea sp.]